MTTLVKCKLCCKYTEYYIKILNEDNSCKYYCKDCFKYTEEFANIKRGDRLWWL